MKRTPIPALCIAIASACALGAVGQTSDEDRDVRRDAAAAVDVTERLSRHSEAELKRFYLACSEASVRGELGSGQIAVCSIGYERLLKGAFGGDFMALHAWSSQLPGVAEHEAVRTVRRGDGL